MFSDRTNWDREEAPLARAARLRRVQGLPILDLTVANPTQCGLAPSPEAVLAPWLQTHEELLRYDPEPFGRVPTREAVGAYYAGHNAAVDPAHICLTASTSEGYSFLFRLLCNPGDEVLIATPSYPLFDYLSALDDVRLVPYPLAYDHGWQIEPGALEARISPRTRAVAVVHPNNPTGHFVSPAERAVLEALCARHGLALIVDEVFLDYPWTGTPNPQSFAQGPHPALTFVLSGLSKVAALPHMKLSWIATFGPEREKNEALARLEIVADAYLSVGAPAQVALSSWLHASGEVRSRIQTRVANNLVALDTALEGSNVSRQAAEGGWYAVLRVPALEDDDALVLLESGVLVHPGSAFGFPDRGWLVISLLGLPAEFETALRLLLDVLGPAYGAT